MTDFDRNIRTLIVCFVLALIGLVSIRIFGVSRLPNTNTRVLGEMKEVIIKNEDKGRINHIILPEVGGIK